MSYVDIDCDGVTPYAAEFSPCLFWGLVAMERLSTLAGHLLPHQSAAAGTAAAPPPHVLIIGGTGLIGRSCAEHFAARDGGAWEITTVARRALQYELPGSRHTHVELDLSDREATQAAIASLEPVTHLIYAAMGTTPQDLDGSAIDVGDAVSGTEACNQHATVSPTLAPPPSANSLYAERC